MAPPAVSLVLRLAGPLQSWGGRSQFNRRETLGEPTKSGITGLLAAAQGRRRLDPIEDLVALRLGVRTDHPGSLLRDFHTVSDYRGIPLKSASVTGRGVQKPTSPAKLTHVTERFYLQDAIFVAALAGPPELLCAISAAVCHPAFPLALGRRACVPTQPLLIRPTELDAAADFQGLWAGEPLRVLSQVGWQAAAARRTDTPAMVDLPVTVDSSDGDDIRADVPMSFDPTARGFVTRRVRQAWVTVYSSRDPSAVGDEPLAHDPFALLGW